MTEDVTAPMTSHPPIRAADDHAAHDRQLIVANACGDLGAEEARQAEVLVGQCRRCAALDRDIRLGPSLTAHLAAPSRPRDFRLTADDAERLRGSTLRRLLRRLGGPGLAPLQPLASAALAVGLLLVVTTTALPGFFAGAGAAPALESRQTDDGASVTGQYGAETSPLPGAPETPDDKALIDTTKQGSGSERISLGTAPDPVPLVGFGLVVVAGAILVVRLIARRVAEDPLLR